MHEHKKKWFNSIQINSPHIPVNKFLFGIKCLRFIPVCVLADGFCLFKYDYLYQTATNKFIEFRVLCSLHCAAVTTKTIPNSYKISTNSNTIDISDFWYRIKCNDSAIGLSSFMHEILLSSDNGNSITHWHIAKVDVIFKCIKINYWQYICAVFLLHWTINLNVPTNW